MKLLNLTQCYTEKKNYFYKKYNFQAQYAVVVLFPFIICYYIYIHICKHPLIYKE